MLPLTFMGNSSAAQSIIAEFAAVHFFVEARGENIIRNNDFAESATAGFGARVDRRQYQGYSPVVTVGAGRVVLTLSVLKTDGVKGTGEAATVPSTTEQPAKGSRSYMAAKMFSLAGLTQFAIPSIGVENFQTFVGGQITRGVAQFAGDFRVYFPNSDSVTRYLDDDVFMNARSAAPAHGINIAVAGVNSHGMERCDIGELPGPPPLVLPLAFT